MEHRNELERLGARGREGRDGVMEDRHEERESR